MVAGQLQDPHDIQAMAPHILERHPNSCIAAAVVYDDNFIREPRALPVAAPLEVPAHFQHSVQLHMHLQLAASNVGSCWRPFLGCTFCWVKGVTEGHTDKTPSPLVLAAPHLSVSSSVLGSRPSSLKAGMIMLSVFVASLKIESTGTCAPRARE